MREWLGPHLVFVHLQMSAEDRRARVLDRHMGETNAADLMDVVSKNMEAIADEEPNTVVLNVTKDMNKEDVLAEILRRIDELQTSGVSKEVTRLLEGYYKSDNHYCQTFKIGADKSLGKDGTDTEHALTIQYGDFGDTMEEVRELTGEPRYTIQIKIEDGETKTIDVSDFGVVVEGGKKMVLKSSAGVATFEKITDEEFIALENDFDDIEAPPGPFKLQPETQGKIIWLSGAPGMGKSTTAQILGRLHGYVYYEADCFASPKNPFIPLDVENPSLAQMRQRVLKGKGRPERLDIMKKTMECWGQLMAGQEYDKEAMVAYYTTMAEDIKTQKERIGGDWAIAHVVMKNEHRAALRKCLGSQLYLVNLVMSTEDRRKRVLDRHMGDEGIGDMMDHFEKLMDPTEEGEENTITVQVSAEMTREDVVHTVLKAVGGGAGDKSDVCEEKQKKKKKTCCII